MVNPFFSQAAAAKQSLEDFKSQMAQVQRFVFFFLRGREWEERDWNLQVIFLTFLNYISLVLYDR